MRAPFVHRFDAQVDAKDAGVPKAPAPRRAGQIAGVVALGVACVGVFTGVWIVSSPAARPEPWVAPPAAEVSAGLTSAQQTARIARALGVSERAARAAHLTVVEPRAGALVVAPAWSPGGLRPGLLLVSCRFPALARDPDGADAPLEPTAADRDLLRTLASVAGVVRAAPIANGVRGGLMEYAFVAARTGGKAPSPRAVVKLWNGDDPFAAVRVALDADPRTGGREPWCGLV